MKGLKFIVIGMLIVLQSCKNAENRRATKHDSGLPKGELVASLDTFQNSASLTITNVLIEGNTIKIAVTYSGGCEEHEFRLLGSEMIQKSLPPQRGILLWHNNNGDSCREMVSNELHFDIRAFAYTGGEIILNLDGWDKPIPYTAVD